MIYTGLRHTLAAAALLSAGGGGAVVPCLAATAPAASPAAQNAPGAAGTPDLGDAIRLEFAMDLVVVCSDGVAMGPDAHSKDGLRDFVWPIVGGRFAGPGLRGEVVPGGADFPVTRPDGVTMLDALYRLRTDDGVTIIIHNHGLVYPAENGQPERVRGFTEFTAPEGKYGWLNKAVFTGILIDEKDMPAQLMMPLHKGESLRLVRIFRMN